MKTQTTFALLFFFLYPLDLKVGKHLISADTRLSVYQHHSKYFHQRKHPVNRTGKASHSGSGLRSQLPKETEAAGLQIQGQPGRFREIPPSQNIKEKENWGYSSAVERLPTCTRPQVQVPLPQKGRRERRERRKIRRITHK